MTKEGKWNIILPYSKIANTKEEAVQKVLIAPQNALASIENPQIIGVVSLSSEKSIKIYYEQDAYDKWLFYYGQDPKKLPEIVYFGQTEKD